MNEIEELATWETIRAQANRIRKTLDGMPDEFKIGYIVAPGGILNAYREGDLKFSEAVDALSKLVDAGYHKGKVELDPPPRFDKVYDENHPDRKAPEPAEKLDWLCWNCGEFNKAGWSDYCWKCKQPKVKPTLISPEHSEDMVEKVAKILCKDCFEHQKNHKCDKTEWLECYAYLARSILKLCQPELKVIKELRYFVANRGAGASTALESNAYSKVLEKIDELTHDQKQIKGE